MVGRVVRVRCKTRTSRIILFSNIMTNDPVWCKYPNGPYDVVGKRYYQPSRFAMNTIMQPFHLLVIASGGSLLNRDQQALIELSRSRRTAFSRINSKASGFGLPTNSGYGWP